MGVAFILKGIQKSSLVMKKTTKESKTDTSMKLTDNSVIIANSLQTRYKNYNKKNVCRRSHGHNSSPPVRMRLHFDGTLSLLSTNVIIECPPTHPPTTISYGLLISRTEL